jgi:Flp pilus assembly protein TadB
MNARQRKVARTVLLAGILVLVAFGILKRRWEALAVAAVFVAHFALIEFLYRRAKRDRADRRQPEDPD